jgi:hypothetical protein
MYVSNGIAYGEETAQRPRIVAARAHGASLEIVLSNGESRIFDVQPFLGHAVYAPLADPEVFRQVRLDHGVPTWLGGEIDFSPDTILARSRAVPEA